MSDRPTDSEMLNWLETHPHLAVIRHADGFRVTARDKMANNVKRHTLRDAIAAAMSASPSPSEPTPPLPSSSGGEPA